MTLNVGAPLMLPILGLFGHRFAGHGGFGALGEVIARAVIYGATYRLLGSIPGWAVLAVAVPAVLYFLRRNAR